MIAFALSVLLFVASVPAPGAIIGDDDFVEWFEERDQAAQKASLATAALIQKSRNWLLPDQDGWSFSSHVPTFAEADRICSGQRFREQISPADCSGFLFSPRAIATAYHCVEPMGGCGNIQVVFNFLTSSATQTHFRFGHDDVFHCQSIITGNAHEDWVILELDRDVSGREPLRFNPDSEARGTVGEPLAIWGHPRGLPLKLAAGAVVYEPSGLIDPDMQNDYFEADLDVFGGSSGAPVINRRTGFVEGILATGFGEFEDSEIDSVTGKECRRLRQMPLSEAVLPWVAKARGIR